MISANYNRQITKLKPNSWWAIIAVRICRRVSTICLLIKYTYRLFISFIGSEREPNKFWIGFWKTSLVLFEHQKRIKRREVYAGVLLRWVSSLSYHTVGLCHCDTLLLSCKISKSTWKKFINHADKRKKSKLIFFFSLKNSSEIQKKFETEKVLKNFFSFKKKLDSLLLHIYRDPPARRSRTQHVTICAIFYTQVHQCANGGAGLWGAWLGAPSLHHLRHCAIGGAAQTIGKLAGEFPACKDRSPQVPTNFLSWRRFFCSIWLFFLPF